MAYGRTSSSTAAELKSSLPAAWLGGLVYGFSTFADHRAEMGRLTFVFVRSATIVLALDGLIHKERSHPVLRHRVLTPESHSRSVTPTITALTLVRWQFGGPSPGRQRRNADSPVRPPGRSR